MRHNETQWKCRPCHFRQRTRYPFLWPSMKVIWKSYENHMKVIWKSYESRLFEVVFQCKLAGGDRFLAMSPSFTNHSVSWTSAMPSPISASIDFEWFGKKYYYIRTLTNIEGSKIAKVQRETQGAAAPFLEPQGLDMYALPRVMWRERKSCYTSDLCVSSMVSMVINWAWVLCSTNCTPPLKRAVSTRGSINCHLVKTKQNLLN